MPPAQKTKPAVKAASPETILKKVDALLADAALDDLTTTVAGQIAQLVGAAAVRVYLRDALTDELHCMVPTNKGLRELRLPPDATSVVGYSAMDNGLKADDIVFVGSPGAPSFGGGDTVHFDKLIHFQLNLDAAKIGARPGDQEHGGLDGSEHVGEHEVESFFWHRAGGRYRHAVEPQVLAALLERQ